MGDRGLQANWNYPDELRKHLQPQSYFRVAKTGGGPLLVIRLPVFVDIIAQHLILVGSINPNEIHFDIFAGDGLVTLDDQGVGLSTIPATHQPASGGGSMRTVRYGIQT